MKCYYHSESDAVAQCKRCGRSLCKECSDKYIVDLGEILCDDCAKEKVESNEKDIKELFAQEKKGIIISSIIGVVVAILAVSLFDNIWFLLAFFLPFGWYKNGESSTERAIWMSGSAGGAYTLGSIIGFIIKLFLCVFLGIPLFIKKIITFYKHYQLLKENGLL